jgi:S-adenosylmethionine hydrolase
LITLTTDFGFSETFVGQMKGVILSIAPDARIIDLAHGIRAHDVRAAALSICTSYRYFPKGTVHVAVVDPGVGSSRAPIILDACGIYFVGPDNGIFTLVQRDCPEARVWRINPEGLELKSPGSTFHGRDLFAPVAARLEIGDFPSEYCQPMEGMVTLSFPEPEREGSVLKGEVIHIDVFGNTITNMRALDVEALRRTAGEPLVAEVAGKRCPLVGYYAEAVSGPHALVNSDGYLEIFLFEKSVAATLGLSIGSSVLLMKG